MVSLDYVLAGLEHRPSSKEEFIPGIIQEKMKQEKKSKTVLKEKFRQVCNEYMDEFCKMAGRKHFAWLPNALGSIVDCDGDILQFDEVRRVVDGKLDVDTYFRYHQYCADTEELGLPYITLNTYMLKHIDEETIERLQNLKKDFENEVVRVKQDF